MTLSRFLRDYLYIPLGGNRHGPARASAALMMTMLLGGLWHGASWSFMLWGGLHGLFLVINRLWGTTSLQERLAHLTGILGAVWMAARIFITFNAVCFAWCFFRLTNFSESLVCLKKWVVFDADKILVGGADDPALWSLLAAYALATLAAMIMTRGTPLPEVAKRLTPKSFTYGLTWGGTFGLLALAAALHSPGQTTPFIYFQF
jgi:D-alanyl-lipoteichoic acid acyltransferase DltB (MBOAT superfamily)